MLMMMMMMMMMTPWITRQQKEMIRYDLFLEIVLDENALFFCTVSVTNFIYTVHVHVYQLVLK